MFDYIPDSNRDVGQWLIILEIIEDEEIGSDEYR